MKLLTSSWTAGRILLPAVFLAYLFCCLGLDVSGIKHHQPDTLTYLTPAKNLASGNGYTVEQDGEYRPWFHRTPGYPLWLAGFMSIFPESLALTCSIWTQRLLLFLVLALLMFPAANSELRQKWRILLFAAITLSPLVLVNGSYLLSDSLFCILLGIAVWLIVRFPDSVYAWLAAAILLGVSALVRPVGIYTVFVLLPFVLARGNWPLRRRAAILLSGLALAFAFPIGWSARNWTHTGAFAFSPLRGYNLVLHRQDVLLSDGTALAQSGLQHDFLALLADGMPIGRSLDILEDRHQRSDFEVDAEVFDLARRAALSHPIDYLNGSVGYAVRLFFSPADAFRIAALIRSDPDFAALSMGEAISERHFPGIALHTLSRLYSLFFFVGLPVWFAVRTWRRKRHPGDRAIILAAVLLAAYFVGLTALLIPTYSRLFLPVLVPIALLFSLGTGPCASAVRKEPEPHPDV